MVSTQRPLQDWEGKNVCYRAKAMERRRLDNGKYAVLLLDIKCWLAGDSVAREIDHMWITENKKHAPLTTKGLRGMGRVERYRRSDGSEDYSLSPVSAFFFDKENLEGLRNYCGGAISIAEHILKSYHANILHVPLMEPGVLEKFIAFLTEEIEVQKHAEKVREEARKRAKTKKANRRVLPEERLLRR